MKTSLKILLVLVSTLVALVCAEIVFRVIQPADSISEYEALTEQDSNQKPFVSRKFQPKRPHPYLGYVYNDALSDRVNNEGFRDLKDLPYQHDEKEFVIGVFGGSFASDFAETQEFKAGSDETDFAERLRQLNPEFFQDKKISFLNFGLASGRQPQQYIAISLFLESLDMAIIIDGFNEAYRNRDLDFPIYFPDYSKFFFSKELNRQEHWSEISQARKKQKALTESILANNFLRSSQLVYRLWRGYNAHIERRISAVVKQEIPTTDFPEDISQEDYNQQKAKLWAKYSRLQAYILKGEKIPYVHITQPNQYLKGTKVLTPEESEKLWPMNANIESMRKSYALILAELKELKQQGFNILDYTEIFKDRSDTIYRDGCCHINRTGNDILEEALAKEVVKALPNGN